MTVFLSSPSHKALIKRAGRRRDGTNFRLPGALLLLSRFSPVRAHAESRKAERLAEEQRSSVTRERRVRSLERVLRRPDSVQESDSDSPEWRSSPLHTHCFRCQGSVCPIYLPSCKAWLVSKKLIFNVSLDRWP